MSVNKNWNTLYSYNSGRIYLHLKNNELVSLNFSVTNDKHDIINYVNNQKIATLNSPPINSTLFLLNDELYGLTPQPTSDETTITKDICGNGQLSLIKYDESDDSWISHDDFLDFNDNTLDTSFYQYSTVLTNPSYNNTVYIYGGECGTLISNRLLSLNFETGEVNNITTSTKPQAFYGASNLLAPNPQTNLIIGGKSGLGWLNMYQLATWDFSVGWSFKQIKKSINMDQAAVGSRLFPLVLPIFDPLDSEESIYDDLKINQVLMIGGESDDDDEQISPQVAKLSMVANDWIWNTTTSSEFNVSYDEILGAATIFNTLLVINSTTSLKRSDDYQINLYDTDTFQPVDTLKENIQSILDSSSGSDTTNNKSKGHGSTEKIILGTVLPIFFVLVALGLIFFFYWRRKKRQQEMEREKQYNEIDYKYGYLEPPTQTNPKFLYYQANDSNSTLSGQSIDSWIKKRQDYDKKRLRNSYLASNDTLEAVDDESPESDSDEPQNLSPLPNTSTRPTKHMKKSFSFSKSPPISPVHNNKLKTFKSMKMESTDNLINNEENTNDQSEEPEDYGKEINPSDASSLDDTMDVQVLVSSKRRSILRVVNPDNNATEDKQSTINEDTETEEDRVLEEHFETITIDENEDEGTSIRQRIPSGQQDD
ncbi:hypothetical protein SBY92_003698 [Candida maltosa Xu316]|uniref:Uncharacterized protein n=1 Tax=Candida maltosa (strain Xu316) TaxID=1245528 RepID=M3HRL9_CANMX|nr:hypothetical protein G210_4805 [Candida maltosa Xu316]